MAQERRERITRDEAERLLTNQRDLMEDAMTKEEAMVILKRAGQAVGYAPAFRCLVMGVEPSESIRW